MGDFTYTTVPGKIKPFLEKIRGVGIPPKATAIWLKSLGFKSSNDASLLGILKAIGLVDNSGVPTGIWSKYSKRYRSRIASKEDSMIEKEIDTGTFSSLYL
jgi:hypothetical protein